MLTVKLKADEYYDENGKFLRIDKLISAIAERKYANYSIRKLSTIAKEVLGQIEQAVQSGQLNPLNPIPSKSDCINGIVSFDELRQWGEDFGLYEFKKPNLSRADIAYWEKKVKKNGGYYQLAAAAMFIADNVNDDWEEINRKLLSAAGCGELKVYKWLVHFRENANPILWLLM